MKRPYVIVGGYMTIDGKIAPRDRDGLKFTPYLSENLHRELHRIRAGVDGVIIGIGTVMAYDYTRTPKLTVRLVSGKNPMRIVLDSHARIPLEATILDVKEAPTLIVVSSAAPKERVEEIRKKGAKVIACGAERVDVVQLTRALAEMGLKRVLVEGGGEVRYSFIKERLVDELFVWVIPSIWGGADAPTLVDGEGFLTRDEAMDFELRRMESRDGLIVLEFTPKKRA